jgi:hypothetical protein
MGEFEHAHIESPVRREPAAKGQAPNAEPHQLLTLQRLAGNAAVSSLIAQRQDGGDAGQSVGGTVTVSSMRFRKQAFIDVDSTNGTITDARAEIS